MQTAQALPVLLLAMPAGVIADSFDRRRLLIGVQAFRTTVALLLATLTASGHMTPSLDTSGLDRAPASFWPEPHIEIDVAEHPGTVLVTNTYWVAAERREEFLRHARLLRLMRRRTGGTSWSLYVDAADPSRHVEQFTVASWSEHLAQHSGRLTGSDREIDQRARSFSDPPTVVDHLFTAALPEERDGRAHSSGLGQAVPRRRE